MGGLGGAKQKTCYGGSMDIFWNHILCDKPKECLHRILGLNKVGGMLSPL